jgi:hypothetical protein
MNLTFPASNWTGADAELTDIRTDEQGHILFEYADYRFTVIWTFTPDTGGAISGDDTDRNDFLAVRVYHTADLKPSRAVRDDGTVDPNWAAVRVCLFTQDLDPSYRYGSITAIDDCGYIERSANSILTAIGQVLTNTH